MGRGIFKWGPKVTDDSITEWRFACNEMLEEHSTDNEEGTEHETDASALSRENAQASTPSAFYEQPAEMQSDEPHVVLDIGEGELHDLMDSDHVQTQTVGLDQSEFVDCDSSGDDLEDVSHSSWDTEYVSDYNSDVMWWISENAAWIDLFQKHGLKQTVMDDILKILKAPFKCWKTVIANTCKAAGLEKCVKKYNACRGHYCFSEGDNELVDRCSVCGTEEEQLDSSNNSTVHYIPLIPRLKSMLGSEEGFKSLYEYHQSFAANDPFMGDYFDSKSYQRIRQLYGGPASTEWDIFIAASTDGFQAYKNQRNDVWPLLAILLNIPPDKRTEVHNVLPLLFTEDGCQPKDLQSYLKPFLNEIIETLPEGIPIRMYDGQVRSVRIHLVWFSCDLDALTKLGGLNGHNGMMPCRYCLLRGVYSESSHHYYFVCKFCSPTSANRRSYDPGNLPPRTERSIEMALRDLERARTNEARKRIARETGIKRGCVLFDIPSISNYRIFPPDIMHLFANVQKQLLSLHLFEESNQRFAVSSQVSKRLDDEIVAFASGISSQTAPAPRSLLEYSNWKTAELKEFTLSYYLILLDGYLPQRYLNGIDHFVELVDICFRSFLSGSDIDEMARRAVRFVKHFERFYFAGDPDKLHYCTYVMHLLLHLADETREVGPPVLYSQYWVEKYIGWILNRLNAKRLAGASFRRAALFSESYKMVHEGVTLQNSNNRTREYEDLCRRGCIFLGPRKLLNLEELPDRGRAFRALLLSYFRRKFLNISLDEARTLANSSNSVMTFSRVRFLRSDNVVTACVASHRENVRASCYVAAEMDETSTEADVYYGRLQLLFTVNTDDWSETARLLVPEDVLESGTLALAQIAWAKSLSKGRQKQVFYEGRRSAAFSNTTTEDASVVKRLISVVEHGVPLDFQSSRVKQRTYFVDDVLRGEKLLQEDQECIDGVNRTLRGFT